MHAAVIRCESTREEIAAGAFSRQKLRRIPPHALGGGRGEEPTPWPPGLSELRLGRKKEMEKCQDNRRDKKNKNCARVLLVSPGRCARVRSRSVQKPKRATIEVAARFGHASV